jgi:hypothetical protein
MKEIIYFYLQLAVIIIVAILSKKMPAKGKMLSSAFIALITIMHVGRMDIKSELLLSISLAILLIVELNFIKLITFQVHDYILLFAAFLIPRRLFNSSFAILGYGMLFLVILSVLFGYGKVKEQYLKGKLFGYYTSFVYLSLTALIFQVTSGYLYTIFRFKLDSNPFMLIITDVILLLLLCCFTFLLQKKLQTPLRLLNTIGNKYSDVEKYILYLCGLTVMIFMIIPIPFILTRTSSDVLVAALAIFYISFLIIQIAFIILIYKITDYKQTLSFMDESHDNESIYYTSLNQNLEAMEKLRHDIKNIFLTMGNFVERSNDFEMKKFFNEKIYPFATEEIEKNYLFSQLYQIPSETLRAFLHLKIFQAHTMNKNIKLTIRIYKEYFALGMDIMDLTRVLGILLDNAFEECNNKSNFFVDIQIKNNENLLSYTIKNTISKEYDRHRLSEGKSTKPGHSGLGLIITEQIVNGYPLVDLNTYVDETLFIQSLNIKKEENL